MLGRFSPQSEGSELASPALGHVPTTRSLHSEIDFDPAEAGSCSLSTEGTATTRVDVPTSSARAIDRLIATLCVALMMFYAATMPAKAAGQIQHAPTLMVVHDHQGSDIFAIDAVHDDHAAPHDDLPNTGDQPDDDLGGSHHHHGDSGPNLLVPSVAAALAIAPWRSPHGTRIERPIAGLQSLGPERPPRTTSLTV